MSTKMMLDQPKTLLAGSCDPWSTVSRQQRRQQQHCVAPVRRCQQSPAAEAAAAPQQPTMMVHLPPSATMAQQQHHRHQQHRRLGVATAATAAVAHAHAAAATAGDLQQFTGVEARAVGALVGSMCGNALGAQVEPEKHYRVSRMFPFGLQDMSWSFDISDTPLRAGHVTGDYVIMAAVGQSVVQAGAADALAMCDAMAACYDASAPAQWYSPYSKLMLEGLAAGSNPFLLAHHAEGYLVSTASRASNSASHRPDRQQHGKTDFTALCRVVPVALTYRNAPLEVLRQAAEAAVLLTHPSDTAADAAVVLAAAVAWCVRCDPASTSPRQLLQHLAADVAVTPEMRHNLHLLQDRLAGLKDLGAIDSWPAFWRGKSWSDITTVANLLTKQNLAVEATQAAALALWVLAVSWQHPKQAVMLAASLGGYAATTGMLVGGLAGALHGSEWVPQSWWEQLQDGSSLHQEQEQHVERQHQEEDSDKDQAVVGAGAEAAAEAAAVADDEGVGAAEADEAEQDEEERGVFSKHFVVQLGQQLAALDCRQPVQLLS